MQVIATSPAISGSVFVTGMHLLSEYGSTHTEVMQMGDWDYKFVNQYEGDTDYAILAKTISGFGDFCREYRPDLIVVHGDRIEALAGALVGASTNTLVAHVEGGEISGTVDDSYRHAITKLSHIHFATNEQARARLLQLGEDENSIHVIGSPELDLMHSNNLPSLGEVMERYAIPWSDYGIAILHPVATERDLSAVQGQIFSKALDSSELNYVVIESNNDRGSVGIRSGLNTLRGNPRFRVLPSMRFDYFLTLLRNAALIVGNSSSGVREAPHYGVAAVNVGTRQSGRVVSGLVVDSDFSEEEIGKAIKKAMSLPRTAEHNFGDGRSAERFGKVMQAGAVWSTPIQKRFFGRAI